MVDIKIPDTWVSKLTSRKFLAALATAIILVTNEQIFHLPPNVITLLVGVVATYILGEAAVDVAKVKN